MVELVQSVMMSAILLRKFMQSSSNMSGSFFYGATDKKVFFYFGLLVVENQKFKKNHFWKCWISITAVMLFRRSDRKKESSICLCFISPENRMSWLDSCCALFPMSIVLRRWRWQKLTFWQDQTLEGWSWQDLYAQLLGGKWHICWSSDMELF